MSDRVDKPIGGQSRLDFARAENAELRRTAPFAEAMAVMRARLRSIDPELLLDEYEDPAPMSQRLWLSAIEVLMAIYSREYNVGYCQAMPEDLASTAKRSIPTYYDIRKKLQQVGLLTIEEGGIDSRDGKRLPARLSIFHPSIESLVIASRGMTSDRYRRLSRPETRTSQNQSESARVNQAEQDPDRTYKETLNPVTNTLSPSPPPGAIVGWEEEERFLRGLGLAEAAKAVAAARESGCRFEAWLKHRNEWEERRATWHSPLGVLYVRLMKLTPDLDPDKGWPPGDPLLSASQDRDVDRDRYDREKAALQQWRDASSDRKTQILIGAGLDVHEATRLLSGDPGKAERLAVSHIAPRLRRARATAMPP